MAARASGEAARAVVRERARPRPVRGAGAALSLAGTRGATRRMERGGWSAPPALGALWPRNGASPAAAGQRVLGGCGGAAAGLLSCPDAGAGLSGSDVTAARVPEQEGVGW